MARVPAILRPLGGPLAGIPDRGERAGRFAAENDIPISVIATRSAALLALGVVGYAILAFAVSAAAGLMTLDGRSLFAASVNSLVLAILTVSGSVLLGAVGALAIVAGPVEFRAKLDRAFGLATIAPTVVVALAALVLVGAPAEIGPAMALVVAVQSVAFGPQVARRFADAARAANASADEAARDLGASPRQRFSVVVWPVIRSVTPGIVGVLGALAVADLAAPVLLASALPTLQGLIWRQAIAGDSAGAAAIAVGLLLFGAVAAFLNGRTVQLPALQRAPIDLGAWSGVVVYVAVAAVAPLVVAPVVLVIASGGADLARAWGDWPIALGTAVIGALLAVVVAHGVRQLGRRGGRLGAFATLAPAPVIGLAIVVALGAMAGAWAAGPVILLVAIGLWAGLQSASRQAKGIASGPAADAAHDLGADPSLAGPPIRLDGVARQTLRTAADVLATGAFAFVILAGISHPVAVSLSASLATERPTAAAAALSILAVVGLLRVAAGWRRTTGEGAN